MTAGPGLGLGLQRGSERGSEDDTVKVEYWCSKAHMKPLFHRRQRQSTTS